MLKPGYREVFVRSADWHGERPRPHQRMFLRLAPPEREDAVVAFATHSGTDTYETTQTITEVRASSGGVSFFGFGASGAMGAMLASRLDRMLAPWDIHLSGPPGYLHLYAHHGPPPGQAEWDRIEHRLRTAPPSMDEVLAESIAYAQAAIDAEERAGLDEQVAADSDGDVSWSAEGELVGGYGADAVRDLMAGRLAARPIPPVERRFLTEVFNYTGEDLMAEFAGRYIEAFRATCYVEWVRSTGYYALNAESGEFLENMLGVMDPMTVPD